ncbi:ferrous iron transport protein B [Robinsoniella sp. KNHs210]|uniref:ferrous iron transport protein B n=1 Tax=Robinsoniella sp. KNHs210 TaxID=1469950 RepID=UPI0004899706|nr:ferrous iron transport protein B [Robinsoniella sp. KNHs210]
MGLNRTSSGMNSVDKELVIQKEREEDKVIALAGNPNVGKSTVFNQLTGMKQHTGNWPGKTVANAQGYCSYGNQGYVMVDIPGCYSLMAHSIEEEVARDFICFEHPDAVVVVCDATCLERNLNLVLQILEACANVVVCVNLMDEAKKKQIKIQLESLSEKTKVPVIGITARSKKGLDQIFEGLNQIWGQTENKEPLVTYPDYIEDAIHQLEPAVEKLCKGVPNSRWLCARLLDADDCLRKSMRLHIGNDLLENEEIHNILSDIKSNLSDSEISREQLSDDIASAFVKKAEDLCRDTVAFEDKSYNRKDRRLDRLFTSKVSGFPIMFLVLLFVFWLTITGANYPSQLLSKGLFMLEDQLVLFFQKIGAPTILYEILVFGIYRVLAWVVSVMLPPMAIFFPLFTLLEDFGYLPRVAFNLDRCFKKCQACGKQALTMCMGFGCNAAGIIGCRIIDSPRERFIAIITNNFVPCNGRLPILISVISMFFVGKVTGVFSSLLSAVILAGIIVLGVIMTLVVSKILSKTILKGMPSSFTLELPPYRRPQIGKVIVRSIFDRTLFVLARAVVIAAPAGLVIWLMANLSIGDMTILTHCTQALDPFAKMLGMDGVILMAFILGLPANEIVIPIMIMTYMAQGSLMEINDLDVLKQLLVQNGWTWVTAVSTMLFTLMHWPCSTTCLTIHKETQSIKWTLVSVVVPAVVGIVVCFVFTSVVRLLGIG